MTWQEFREFMIVDLGSLGTLDFLDIGVLTTNILLVCLMFFH